MGYMDHLVAHWDMSEVNPQNLSPRANAYLKEGLIAHYKMNDNAANTNVIDSVGGNTMSNFRNTSIISVSGKINNALDCDGTNDRLTLGSVLAEIDPLKTSFSIAGWIDPDGGTVNQQCVFENSDGATFGVGLIIYSDTLRAGIYNIGDAEYSHTASGAFTASDWSHFAVVYDIKEDTLTLYINGVAQVGTSQPFLSLAAGCTIASRSDLTTRMSAKVDDFRYYQRALSAEEILSLYASDNGTEGYGDNSGEGKNIGSSNLDEGINNGIGTRFNGVDEYVDIYWENALDFTEAPMSVFAWFKQDILGSEWVVCKNGADAVSTQYGFYIDNANNRINSYLEGSNRSLSPNNSVRAGVWHFGGFTWDGETVYAYVDGVQGTASAYSGSLTSRENMSIGRRYDAGYFDGTIDEVMIFDEALTQIQVEDLYAKTRIGRI